MTLMDIIIYCHYYIIIILLSSLLCILVLFTIVTTSASVKSYQLVKVVSGGRAPGKSSSLASPQLLVIERFLRFGAVRLEKNQFLYATAFGTCIWSYIQWGICCKDIVDRFVVGNWVPHSLGLAMSIVKRMCTRSSELERLGNAWVSTANRLVPLHRYLWNKRKCCFSMHTCLKRHCWPIRLLYRALLQGALGKWC